MWKAFNTCIVQHLNRCKFNCRQYVLRLLWLRRAHLPRHQVIMIGVRLWLIRRVKKNCDWYARRRIYGNLMARRAIIYKLKRSLFTNKRLLESFKDKIRFKVSIRMAFLNRVVEAWHHFVRKSAKVNVAVNVYI